MVFAEALDFLVELVDLKGLLLVLLDLGLQVFFEGLRLLRLLGKLLGKLLVFLDLLGQGNLHAPLALFELLNLCQGRAQRNAALVLER